MKCFNILIMILFASFFMFGSCSLVYADNVQTENSVVYAEVDNEKVYYDTLSEAISNASTDSEYKIYLLKDLEINSKIVLAANNDIVIDGNGFKIMRGISKGNVYAGTFFDIVAKSKLKLINCSIDGGNDWILNSENYNKCVMIQDSGYAVTDFINSSENGVVASSYMFYNRGVLYLDEVRISNHYSKSYGIIYGYTDSVATLYNSVIKHNASYAAGGAVFNGDKSNATIYMDGNTLIEDNFGGSNGGLIRLYTNSKAIINDTQIINNRGFNSNGYITMMYGATSTFELNGGLISNNSAIAGNNGRIGAIYVHKNGKFVMNGGIIQDNIANSRGAIDGMGEGATIELNGGTVQNNFSVKGGEVVSDVSIYRDYDLVLGEDFVINGNIYVEGNLINNGTITGKITLDITKSIEDEPLINTGKISGDVVVYFNESDYVDKKPEIDTSNIEGNVVNCEGSNQVLVKFYYNGGVDSAGLTDHGLISVYADQVPVPIQVTKKGHNVEWYLDKELTKKWNNEVLPDRSTLFAKWIPKEYTITWNMNGKIIKTVMKYGATIELPEVIKKEGYDFVGWNNYSYDMTMPDNDLMFTAEYKISVPKTNDDLLSFVVINLFACSAIIFYARKRLYR